ncbi:MAG: acyl-ACP--UDP-N-acetylglucosamine O-acyltransferase [Pigmentiphaga sp.]|nr:acyl-ACP--UDP-N-acetylglucosamine O-acyltransferase [Pigmentiphaga sp.]
MSQVHPTALIDPAAALDSSVQVDAYAVIGPHVRIGAGSVVGPHCVIQGHTTIGENNRFFQSCSIGAAPQDKKYADEPTRLEIGNNNTVREFCTINIGTVQDQGLTRIGHDNWIMAYVHVAHDCLIGNQTILANGTQLAGHVHLGDYVILGGMTGVHQFVKIGAHAMTSVHTTLLQDLPPFVTCAGSPAEPVGINVEGLKRRGFSKEEISALRQAYKVLYRQGLSLEAARNTLRETASQQPEAAAVLTAFADFTEIATRGLIR